MTGRDATDVHAPRPRRSSASIAVRCLAAFALAAPVAAQRPDVDTVLARGAEYVERYVDAMANLTAEERFTQDLLPVTRWVMQAPGDLSNAVQTAPTPRRDLSHRELTSDVVLLRVGPPLGWRVYRDVFEVNGKPVRDRDERLQTLFLAPAETAAAQSVRIAEESARFNLNLAGVERTLNAPGLPLGFLQAALRPRFSYVLDRRDRGAVWVVRYEERVRPTVFQHNRTLDNPSSGRLWIDVDTGRVLRTEQTVTPAKFTVTVTTTFEYNDVFGIAVPVEMREQISGTLTQRYTLEGIARYSKYRRFEIRTDEKTAAPDD
jgi:hypothetical protein